MSADLVVEEAQRARWARWLRRNGLDDSDRDDFGKGGVARRAEKPGVRFVVLPSDPERCVLELDTPFWTWMAGIEARAPAFGSNPVRWGHYEVPTSEGGARVEMDGRREAVWRRWFMSYRSGGFEFGLPSLDRENERLFLLLPTVGRIWAALDLHRELVEQHSVCGPFLAVLGLTGTAAARLVRFGQGWEHAEMLGDEARCVEKHLMFSEQFTSWPDPNGAKALAVRFGGRMEDGFGSRARRFSGNRDGKVVDFDGEAFD